MGNEKVVQSILAAGIVSALVQGIRNEKRDKTGTVIRLLYVLVSVNAITLILLLGSIFYE